MNISSTMSFNTIVSRKKENKNWTKLMLRKKKKEDKPNNVIFNWRPIEISFTFSVFKYL